MLLEGKRLVITGVLTDDSIAWHTARLAQEQGARLVLTGFGRSLRLTERAAKRLPDPPDVLELDINRPEDLALGEDGQPLRPALPYLRSDDFLFGGREQPLEEGITPVTVTGSTVTPLLYYIPAAIVLVGLLWLLNYRYAVIDRVPVYLQAAYERNGGRAPAWLANWARWAMLTPIERSFETVNRSLRLLGAAPASYATPAERAKSLLKKLPIAAGAIETLLGQHQASLFTPDPGQPGLARRASLDIWYYTLRAIFQRFLYGQPIE